MYRYILIIMGYLLVAGTLNGYATDNVWIRFINNPDIKTYIKCQETLHDSLKILHKKGVDNYKDTPVFKALVSNDKLYYEFIQLVEKKKNRYAIELALQLYPFTDASTKEDLCQAIGVTITDPTHFLRLLKRFKINDNQEIGYFITMYPLEEYVDDLNKRLLETKRRIALFETVKDPELSTLKDICINILTDLQKSLEKSLKEKEEEAN